MESQLVFDVGNWKLKAALFAGDVLQETFSLLASPLDADALKGWIRNHKAERTLVASVNDEAGGRLCEALEKERHPYQMLQFSDLDLTLDVDEPEQVGHDRLANAYGALHRWPTTDCVVIDIGTAVTFDFVKRSGCYCGGAIYPGLSLGAKALHDYTSKLPLVSAQKPPSPLARTTETHIQCGLYYGLLGAIERIVAELRPFSDSPGSVRVLATGGATAIDEPGDFIHDLKDLVDDIDPHLTVVGLNQILKERSRK